MVDRLCRIPTRTRTRTVAHVCWTPTCAQRPRSSCLMGDRRKIRGPPYGWPKLLRPAPGQLGTLRVDILVDRRRIFSLVSHGPLTSVYCVRQTAPAPRCSRPYLVAMATPHGWSAHARMARGRSIDAQATYIVFGIKGCITVVTKLPIWTVCTETVTRYKHCD